jgi:hypothetical protein
MHGKAKTLAYPSRSSTIVKGGTATIIVPHLLKHGQSALDERSMLGR